MCRNNTAEAPKGILSNAGIGQSITIRDIDAINDAIKKLELVEVAADVAHTYNKATCSGLSLIVFEVLEELRLFVGKVEAEWRQA